MAYYYMDTDAAGTASGLDWTNAVVSLENLLTKMTAPGDIGYVMGGSSVDTTAATRTFTSAGTVSNPCKIIGVKTGTTNTGASVVASDLPIRGTDTLAHISNTGASSDIKFDSGYATWSGLHFTSGDQWNMSSKTFLHTFINCELTLADDLILNGDSEHMVWINCEYEPLVAGVDLRLLQRSSLRVFGGGMAATANPTVLLRADAAFAEFTGFDMTNLGNNTIQSPTADGRVSFTNCKTPATFTELGSTPTKSSYSLTMVGCNSNTAAKTSTESFPDYYYGDAFGSIVNHPTIVRTGGADDSASGAFSYAMTPHANATLEGTGANLKSPQMAVWLAGGANTLTVYFCNDSASTDYNEDEVWIEWFTPDAGDTAQHDQTFTPAGAGLLDSSTAITDDTGSTWGTGGNNHQKLSITVTTGFEGWAYARLHLAKRSATPDTLFLDPKIEVS